MGRETHLPATQQDGAREKRTTFDDVLPEAGEFGPYQVFLFAMTVPFYFFLAFVYNSQQIITEAPDRHWCWIPELANLTVEERMTLAIPPENGSRYGFSRCRSYKANWSRVLDGLERPGLENEPCQHGWEFHSSDTTYTSISAEMGWVCDKDNYQALAQAIFFCGSIVGGVLIGFIADSYGRLPALILSNLLACVGGVSTSFANNFNQFCICRFITGMGYDNLLHMMYILVMEYTGPRYRSLMANISFGVVYCIAAALLPWLSIACGSWRLFVLVTSAPMCLALAAYFLLPESPRWLLSVGKVDETVKILKKIGKVNRHPVSESSIQNFTKSASQERSTDGSSLLQLRNHRPVLRLLLLQTVVFITADMAFDGMARMAGKIGYDFAITFTLSSLTEFPSMMLLIFSIDRCGRRFMFFSSMLLGGVFSMVGAVVESGISTVVACVAARFCFNMGYNSALQWAAECLPTAVRGSGVVFIHISGYVAVILSPFIVYLETIMDWLPLVVIGAICGCGAAAALFLPETCGKPLPQTLEDSGRLLEKHSVCSFSLPCLRKREKC